MEKKNDKTVQTNEMMELTLDQMDKVSGGTGSDEFGGFNAEPFYNGNNTDISIDTCPNNPDGIHFWMPHVSNSQICVYCNSIRNKI